MRDDTTPTGYRHHHLAALRARLREAELCLGGNQGHFPVGLQVCQPSDHGTHEGPLFLRRFIIDEGLNYCYPASAVRNEQRPVPVRRPPNSAAGIDFKVGYGDYVR